MSHATHIEFDFDQDGYTVQVIRGGEIIEEYNAGNNPFDSVSYSAAESDALPLSEIKRLAGITALEMSVEFEALSVSRNSEIRAEEI